MYCSEVVYFSVGECTILWDCVQYCGAVYCSVRQCIVAGNSIQKGETVYFSVGLLDDILHHIWQIYGPIIILSFI